MMPSSDSISAIQSCDSSSRLALGRVGMGFPSFGAPLGPFRGRFAHDLRAMQVGERLVSVGAERAIDRDQEDQSQEQASHAEQEPPLELHASILSSGALRSSM